MHSLLLLFIAVFWVSGFSGCRPQLADEEPVLRVGVIASLRGPARPWGLATVRCAQVIADYYNDRGGFLVQGQRVKIELIIVDDAFNASKATSVAHDLTTDGVNYVIGPLGDSTVTAAARVLDGSGVFYVHYGFDQVIQSANSLGVLGVPLPEQSLPILLKHLREIRHIQSVLVMAYGTEEGIRQKEIAENLAIDAGLALVPFSSFDVSEETFDLDLNLENLRRKVKRIVAADPEAILLAGCPPEACIILVDHLRQGGYLGVIATQNSQVPDLFAKIGAASDDVYFMGGPCVDEGRSAYFKELKARYLDLAGTWNHEAEVKLYALEFMLACIRQAGLASLEETSVMYRVLPDFSFVDPFYEHVEMIRVNGGMEDGLPWQMQTVIRISKMSGGQAILIEEVSEHAPEIL
ncbi:ABC transporter substrate-binding protein [Coraliomargarita sp. SDUM461004]|uniref:ABC transporter substrate-binding protein n=1 Tax=Thalassobacterium sedimentorum TaxID=3041258 RepID=A0ABU1AFB9_9BACT|nr:ABC transporter substrate-binding protein [Coraliomargarita sp. SDUM461004]MDQ8193455.1 ABC transporter substrate-binding protein [Coraliomargarita sp. SDUM461004]